MSNTTNKNDESKEKEIPSSKNMDEVESNSNQEQVADAASKEELEVNTEDNLEIKRMPFKERMRFKKQRLIDNMDGMSKKEKFQHLFYYYKWHAFAVIAILFLLISVPVSIYKNKRPVALSYAVMNTPNAFALKTSLIDDYVKYYDLKKGYQVRSNTNVVLSLETYEENYDPENASYSQFPTLCYSGEYDIIISDYAGAEFCSNTSLTHILEESLSEDVYNIMLERYPDLIVELPNYNNTPCAYAFDISDTSFAKNFNLGYDKVYVSFIGLNDQNKLNATRFLNYIFDLGMEL